MNRPARDPESIARRAEDAKRVLAQCAIDREWEHFDDPSHILDQLVPYATMICEAEGHDDVTMVLERELNL